MTNSLLHAATPEPAALNLAGYAAHRKAKGLTGQSHVAVWQAIKTGRIVEPAVRRDGRRWMINPVLADQQWEANTRSSSQCQQRIAISDLNHVQPTWDQEIIDAKVRRAQSIAEREELALRRQKGELLHVQDVRKRWRQNAEMLREAFLQLPSTLSKELAKESDPKRIEGIIASGIVNVLEAFANG